MPRRDSKLPPAMIFGLHEGALAAARSLARRGVRVHGYDVDLNVASPSRHLRDNRCPDPADPAGFRAWLAEEAGRLGGRPVVLVTADEFLPPLSAMVDEAAGREVALPLRLNIARTALLEQVQDKARLRELARSVGVANPRSFPIPAGGFAQASAGDTRFPVLVKGRNSVTWRTWQGHGRKAFVCHSLDELSGVIEASALEPGDLVVEEYIPGGDDAYWKYCCQIDSDGRQSAEFTLRKLRQSPPGAGTGCMVEAEDNEQLRVLGRALFTALEYRGIGSAEFKLDPRDGEFKLIEINPRIWQQAGLAVSCGVDMPWLHYAELCGLQPPVAPARWDTRRRWLNIYDDLQWLRPRIDAGEITPGQWLRSLRPPIMLSNFSWDDPLPMLRRLRPLRWLRKRLARWLRPASGRAAA